MYIYKSAGKYYLVFLIQEVAKKANEDGKFVSAFARSTQQSKRMASHPPSKSSKALLRLQSTEQHSSSSRAALEYRDRYLSYANSFAIRSQSWSLLGPVVLARELEVFSFHPNSIQPGLQLSSVGGRLKNKRKR